MNRVSDLRDGQKLVFLFHRLWAFLLLPALLLASCEKKAPASFDRPPAPVTVVTAVAQDVPIYLDEIGKFVAREVVSIQPQVSGQITRIQFTDGANLNVGQVLFTIDPRPYELNLSPRRPTLAKPATLELAKITLTVSQALPIQGPCEAGLRREKKCGEWPGPVNQNKPRCKCSAQS
jgi:multidrug efflux pump subunit AcrA (membrane-fusion protein)